MRHEVSCCACDDRHLDAGFPSVVSGLISGNSLPALGSGEDLDTPHRGGSAAGAATGACTAGAGIATAALPPANAAAQWPSPWKANGRPRLGARGVRPPGGGRPPALCRRAQRLKRGRGCAATHIGGNQGIRLRRIRSTVSAQTLGPQVRWQHRRRRGRCRGGVRCCGRRGGPPSGGGARAPWSSRSPAARAGQHDFGSVLILYLQLDHVVVLQEMLLDRLAIDQVPLVLPRSSRNESLRMVMSWRARRSRQGCRSHVVVALAADGGALLGERNSRSTMPSRLRYQLRHRNQSPFFPNQFLSRPAVPGDAGKGFRTCTKIRHTLSRLAVVVGHLHQLISGKREVCLK